MSFFTNVLNFVTRKNKKGKDEKVYYIEKNDGTRKYLFNPSQRGEKYANELHTKVDHFTGEQLSNTQLAYRSGYMRSRNDNYKAYKANQKKKEAAKAARKAKKEGN